MKTVQDVLRGSKSCITLLLFILLTGLTLPCAAQTGPPPPPPPPPPNTNNYNTNSILPNSYTFPLVSSPGTETLLMDTFPANPNPTQVYPSWGTMQTAGLTVDTNGFIVDTNANPQMSDGMMAGKSCGVVPFTDTNAHLITRGQFLVLLNNANGEIQNTQFDVKIFRNTNAFAGVLGDTMAEADYTSTDTNVSLTPVSGVSNLYQLSLNFPPCVCVAGRVICIMTEPINTDYQFSQLQWLQGGVFAASTMTTALDYSLTPGANTPAMRLWVKRINGVGIRPVLNSTPGLLGLQTIPGAVIYSTTNLTAGFTNSFSPDEAGFADWDMTQDNGSLFKVELDNAQ